LNHAFLFLAGIGASIVNATAGGGTLISFPALLAAGLLPLHANATSAVALQAGLLTSAWAQRRELAGMRADVLRLLPPCVIGGTLGALLALKLGAKVFAAVVPWLLLAGSLLILLQPLFARFLARHVSLHDHPLAFQAASFVLALYGGYFGAGGGILFLAALALLLPRPFGELNALKNLAMPASNGIGALTFAIIELSHPSGIVVWTAVPLLALGAFAGGIIGVRLARRLPALALRLFSGLFGVAMALYLAIH
jgi:uncharacterized membrane protein YfcA